MKRSKKAQLELSYGMIFSVILIAVFLFVAIFAIMHFMNIGKLVETGVFIKDLQNEINRIWTSAGGEDIVFSKKINSETLQYICFFNQQKEAKGEFKDFSAELKRYSGSKTNNLHFYPASDSNFSPLEIKHIDIEKITKDSNPYCIKLKDKEIKLRLQKSLSDTLVTISSA